MNKLQSYILNIVKYFDSFCKSNNIEYCVMGGSALGAARHSGFIPWDDDFDVFMTLDNYLKLVSLKKQFDSSSFCFQPMNSLENSLYMGKIRMRNTLLIEGNGDRYNQDICHGIYIDIMVLFDGSIFPIGRIRQYFFAKVLSANRLFLDGYRTKSMYKRVFTLFSNFFIKLIGKKYLFKSISKRRYRSKFYCHLFGRAPYSKSFYPKTWFQDFAYIEFEDMRVPIMANYDDYLTLRYGKNYMKMPSKETISRYPSHAYYVNYNNSFYERNDDYIEEGVKK